MSDTVYCPPNVDCPCYAALTAENERLRTVNAEMLALFDKLGATIERLRSREYRTYLLIRRLGFDCGSAKFTTKKEAALEEK
jgi:hypothetical protein